MFTLTREAQTRMVERGISEGMVRAAVKKFHSGEAVYRPGHDVDDGVVRILLQNQRGQFGVVFDSKDSTVITVTWTVESKDGIAA